MFSETVREWVELSFEAVKQDYLAGSGGKLSLEVQWYPQDLSGLLWEDYFGGNWGLDRGWITADTKKKSVMFGDTIDCVVYFIPTTDWAKEGNQDVYGWNMGAFFNGYQVEQVRTVAIERYNHLTLSMELLHALDNIIDKSKGLKFTNKLFNVADFDEDIAHDDQRWYKGYRNEIGILTPALIEVLAPREKNIAIIEILKKLVELYRLLIIAKSKKPSPVIHKK